MSWSRLVSEDVDAFLHAPGSCSVPNVSASKCTALHNKQLAEQASQALAQQGAQEAPYEWFVHNCRALGGRPVVLDNATGEEPTAAPHTAER
jgi:hypothetical protein